jgi:predicted nucleic acid-binding protein
VALSALDASVLIALLDPGDAHHQAARASLDAHADDDLRIPAHALAEALVHPARAGKDREARRLIAGLEIAVDPVDETVAVAAAKLRAKHGSALRMPDALVLAYADVRKARSILTADVRWRAWSTRVEIVNPELR